MARSQAEEMHEGINYDFHIDTTNASVTECAEIILEQLPRIAANSAIVTMKEKAVSVFNSSLDTDFAPVSSALGSRK
jgi:hypothetical protein